MDFTDIFILSFMIGMAAIPIASLYLLFFNKKKKADYIREMKVLSIISLIVLGVPAGYTFVKDYTIPSQASPDLSIQNLTTQQNENSVSVIFTTADPARSYIQTRDTVTGEENIVFSDAGYVPTQTHRFEITKSSGPIEALVFINGEQQRTDPSPLIIE